MKKIILSFSFSLLIALVLIFSFSKKTSALDYNNVDNVGVYFISIDSSSGFGNYVGSNGSLWLKIYRNETEYNKGNSTVYQFQKLDYFVLPNNSELYGSYANQKIYYFGVPLSLIQYVDFYYLGAQLWYVSNLYDSNNGVVQVDFDSYKYYSRNLSITNDLFYSKNYISIISNKMDETGSSGFYPIENGSSFSSGYGVYNVLMPNTIIDYYNENISGLSPYVNNSSNDFQAYYNNGYEVGYNNGRLVANAYEYNNGYNTGYNIGYNDGLEVDDHNWLGNGLLSLVDIPIMLLSSIFNFDILGLNIYYLILGLLTLGIVLWLIKKFIFK